MGVQKFVAIIIIIKFADVMSISTLKPNDLGFGISPDYLEERVIVEPEMDLRQKFLRNKESNRKEKEKIQVLDKTIQNTTVYQDGIAHGLISKRNPNGQKIMDIENEFIDIVMMDKVKYIYKRDEYWRTWREVNFNGNKTIVCYRCQNSNSNCSGSWVIEEDTPPCPYELFSVIDKDHLCVANYSQYKTINNLCPQIIKFNDLSAKCNNPIETSWQVNPNYDIKQDRDGYICKRNEICEFSTSYWIYSGLVVFRIIDTTQKVLYSRVMADHNYACINDCGIIDIYSKKPIISYLPLEVNLLAYDHGDGLDNDHYQNDADNDDSV